MVSEKRWKLKIRWENFQIIVLGMISPHNHTELEDFNFFTIRRTYYLLFHAKFEIKFTCIFVLINHICVGIKQNIEATLPNFHIYETGQTPIWESKFHLSSTIVGWGTSNLLSYNPWPHFEEFSSFFTSALHTSYFQVK